MSTVVTFPAPRRVALVEREPPALGPGQVRLATLYSGISAGTELSAYRGTTPYLAKRWDEQLRLFHPDQTASLRYPLEGLGYEEVGRVVEVAADVDDVALGALVYGTWGHRSEHVVDAPYARERTLPSGLDPLLGIFSHIGAIALNGVHDAGIRIGETVAVFGLGVPGQVVAQLAARSGAHVIGVDPIALRRDTALRLGAAAVALDPNQDRVAEAIRDLTDGRGADVSVEVSGIAAALHEAIRATAYSARVVALGFFQGGAGALALGDEFHHNRITVVSSQIGGVAPERSYRWDRARLVRRAMTLQAEGVLDLAPLVSHVLPFEAAAHAFELLDARPEETLQVVLRLSEAER